MTKAEERLLIDGRRPDHDAYTNFLDEFRKETPRGVVLIACATLHDLLGRLIELFLVRHKAGR